MRVTVFLFKVLPWQNKQINCELQSVLQMASQADRGYARVTERGRGPNDLV